MFGAEYLFFPGFFSFAYVLHYPVWVRWLGGLLLAVGTTLLGFSHHHLGKNFHSLVVSKNQVLVETGPYRWIRHPIYTAYLMNYLGGGLLSSNLILTLVPVTMYGILVALRVGKEEAVMRETFGQTTLGTRNEQEGYVLVSEGVDRAQSARSVPGRSWGLSSEEARVRWWQLLADPQRNYQFSELPLRPELSAGAVFLPADIGSQGESAAGPTAPPGIQSARE